MAPRAGGKRRKVGLTWMDAALDAMRPLGFSDSIVRKSVKNLLKVYGNDGWAFIEEAAYKVLIDTILEVDEQPQLNLIEYQRQQQQQLAMCGPETLQEERSEEHKPLTLEEINTNPPQKRSERAIYPR
ncbi:hypothetical protein RJ639_005527 [Escallonia herrerae]|uniref:WIYLD domain-containing protein n=1 Tax=Escallonia herrerae TaxID=1293975 RepID=A0AA88W0Z8_9ASTE|nr:hypothetical protein RJ639_005527 [Escallonia herrerae]